MSEVTTISYNGFALDSLGEVSVLSQTGRMMPDKLGQKEIRQLHIRIEMFEQDYDTNMSLILQARESLEEQNKDFIWVSPGVVMMDGSEAPGTTQLNRPVVVVSHDFPEDPNAWGSYNQQINVVIEYEFDLTDPTVHMAATFLQTGSAGQPANLGMVYGFTPSYRSTKYSELRNIRDRAAGTVNLKGEIVSLLSDQNGNTDNRRATLQGLINVLNDQVNGRDGTLQFGLQDGVTFFNQVVRVSAFEAHVNQALNGIEWSMTADWTEFPNEATYAAADFKVDRSEDRETGEKIVRLAGTIGAPTPTIANAKLTLLMQTVIFNAQASDQDAGWKGLAPVRFSTTPRYINADDTQSFASPVSTQQMGTENNGVPTSNNVFLTLDFSVEWRKKSASLLSWKFTINTVDDTSTGFQRITFSGSVVASGSTAGAAWTTALAQARVLGDQKYPFRMNYTETRHDRFTDAEGQAPQSFNPIIGLGASSAAGYVGNGIQEFVSCDFSYEYRVKGIRIYLEARAEKTISTFGENGMRVSGFVVAQDAPSALTAYTNQVKNTYLPALVLEEDLSDSVDTIQTGAPWGQANGFATLFSRLDFSFRIWTAKGPTGFAIQFGVKIDLDYVNLKRSINVDGTYWDTQANIVAAENRVTNNPLDAFLSQFISGQGGNLTNPSDSRTQSHDYLAKTNDNQMGLRFSVLYVAVITNPTQQILETSLSEDLQYSGNRLREFATPNGPSAIQTLGITMGTRTVSGSVTAATEAAAVAWLAAQRIVAFPSGTTGAIAVPAPRYLQPPRISTSFVFLPLTVNPVGRGAGVNFQVVKKDFSFAELLPLSRYTDGNGTV